jgi:hypothetical protein
MLGHKCERWLWLSFRWAVIKKHDGRLLRLFRRGKLEEFTVIDDLKKAGLAVYSDDGTAQFRVDFGCHVSGSVDGVIESGVPHAPKSAHILEIKTHSKKSFNDLEGKGVQESKPMHHAQMQVYMYGMHIERALYAAVCKDDDRLYFERVKLDIEFAVSLVNKGKRIALLPTMPPPLSSDPSWYECKFCDAYEFCHQTKTTREINCRTCAHSTPTEKSTWVCERFESCEIPLENQRSGCSAHVLHPDLVPWDLKLSEDGWDAIYIIDGNEVKNGERARDVFDSAELLADPAACSRISVSDLDKDIREGLQCSVGSGNSWL